MCQTWSPWEITIHGMDHLGVPTGPQYGCNLFFFFKQKTAYEIRKGDWSSDVCLPICGLRGIRGVNGVPLLGLGVELPHRAGLRFGGEIGRASCRERVPFPV